MLKSLNIVYKVYHTLMTKSYSVVGLEWAGPGVGGGVIFPLSVSVGLALEFLFSDVLISVSLSLLDRDGGYGGDKG